MADAPVLNDLIDLKAAFMEHKPGDSIGDLGALVFGNKYQKKFDKASGLFGLEDGEYIGDLGNKFNVIDALGESSKELKEAFKEAEASGVKIDLSSIARTEANLLRKNSRDVGRVVNDALSTNEGAIKALQKGAEQASNAVDAAAGELMKDIKKLPATEQAVKITELTKKKSEFLTHIRDELGERIKVHTKNITEINGFLAEAKSNGIEIPVRGVATEATAIAQTANKVEEAAAGATKKGFGFKRIAAIALGGTLAMMGWSKASNPDAGEGEKAVGTAMTVGGAGLAGWQLLEAFKTAEKVATRA